MITLYLILAPSVLRTFSFTVYWLGSNITCNNAEAGTDHSWYIIMYESGLMVLTLYSPLTSVMLMVAVWCWPMVARVEELDRTAVSISVPSTVVSVLLVNGTNCSVSLGWKVTVWLVISVKSANSEVWNRNYKNYRFWKSNTAYLHWQLSCVRLFSKHSECKCKTIHWSITCSSHNSWNGNWNRNICISNSHNPQHCRAPLWHCVCDRVKLDHNTWSK